LVESIEQGFCTIEMFFDENDKPVDFLRNATPTVLAAPTSRYFRFDQPS